ncbi:hypothetical protein pb186bvf_003152 [Paramecium bursaria]
MITIIYKIIDKQKHYFILNIFQANCCMNKEKGNLNNYLLKMNIFIIQLFLEYYSINHQNITLYTLNSIICGLDSPKICVVLSQTLYFETPAQIRGKFGETIMNKICHMHKQINHRQRQENKF